MSNPAQNWLTGFPLSMKPDSWELNSIFLSKLKDLEDLWDALGYRIQLGMEVEFRIIEPDAAAKDIDAVKNRPLAKKAGFQEIPLMEAYLDAARDAQPSAPLAATLEDLYDYFRNDPDANTLLRQTKMTRKGAMTRIGKFESDLQSGNRVRAEKARRNIFLAHLHTKNFDQGGLRDIIEPRFGDKKYGIGWNDVTGAEIRTKILNSPLDIIARYHQYLEAIHREATKFGLIIDLAYGDPQFHISIVRISDSKNMMEMRDEESIAFCERTLTSLRHTLKDFSFMIADSDINENFACMNFSAGSNRLNTIRILNNNWEWRRTQTPTTHAARILTLLLMGMAAGNLKQTQDYIDTVSIERKVHPLVTHKGGNTLSGLKAVIEHCTINDDGSLTPDIDVIKAVIWRLKHEVPRTTLECFSVQTPLNEDIYFDLTHPSAWNELLIRLIKITADNRLDTSAIENMPEIIKVFDSITINGRRTSLSMPGERITTASHQMTEALQRFFSSPVVHHFFTPFEQTEIARVYTHRSRDIATQVGEYIVESIEASLPIYKKTFSGCDDAFIKNQLIREKYDYFFQRVPKNVDFPLVHADALLKNFDQSSCPRAIFVENPSYQRTLRQSFDDAIERRMPFLDPDNGHDRDLLYHLSSFQSQVKDPAECFSMTITEIRCSVISLAESMANGDFIRQHGGSPVETERVCNEKAKDITSHLAIIFHDERYSDRQIAEHCMSALQSIEYDLNSHKEILGKEPGRELSAQALEIYSIILESALIKVCEWALKNVEQQQKSITDQPTIPSQEPIPA